MKKGNIQILDLDFEFKLWKNTLHFYTTELDIILDRFQVLKREVPSFYIENDKVDMIMTQQKSIIETINNINTLEQEIAFYAEDYPINEKHNHFIQHEVIRNVFENIRLHEYEIISLIYPMLCYPLHSTGNNISDN